MKELKKKNPYNDYMSIVKTATKWLERSESKIKQRCLIEGCRYGIGLPLEKPQDKCIYCGEPRPDYEGIKFKSLVKEFLSNTTPSTQKDKQECTGNIHHSDNGKTCNCGSISVSTPSPLDSIEDILEINFPDNAEKHINSLIKNQTKIINYLKGKK